MENEMLLGDGSSSMDRISQLPQHILHHILYFLSQKEAAQTSLLSKAWRYTWSTRPNVEFHHYWFEKAPHKFYSFLNKTLQAYHDQELCIQEFVVGMLKIEEDPESISFLENWIPTTIQMGRIKKFHLYASSHNLLYDLYDMPPALFEAKSLQDLHIRGCSLGRTTPAEIFFKQLKKLWLVSVRVEDEVFTRIISSCPLIEDMGLDRCEGLRNVKVNNLHNLKGFTFINYRPIDNMKIKDTCIWMDDVPNLEKIDIRDIDDTANLLRCLQKFSNLKSLALNDVWLSSKSFEYFSCKYLHSLEKLDIDDCYGFDEFHLTSHTIKHLSLILIEQERLVKAVIDTPNLVLFEYTGYGDYVPYSLSFARTSSVWLSMLSLGFQNSIDDASAWFLNVRRVLKALSKSETSVRIYQLQWNVQLSDYTALFVEDEPVRVECLEIREAFLDIRDCVFICSLAFLDCFFRICRPMRIDYYESCADTKSERKSDWEEVIEVLNKVLKGRDSVKRDGVNEGERHWLQDLEEVNMEAFDQEDHIHETESPDFSFQLKWRKA